jgi:cobalt-zinc-cadmium efflux system outer membrane protein
MPTRAQVCSWIAGCGLIVPSFAMAQDRTERDVVELIVRDGPQAQAIRAAIEVVRREHQARLAFPNPGVTYSRESAGFTEFLQFEQSLPVFGTRGALIRAGVEAEAAAAAERDARLAVLRADAAVLVTELAAAQARLDAAQAYVRDVERLVEILRTREREGEGSRFDRVRAEQEVRETRAVATAAAIDVASVRASLAALMPRDTILGRVASTVDPMQAAPPTETLLLRAATTRAELRALQHASSRAQIESEAARRARWPVPTLVGGFKRADDAGVRADGGVIGVALSLPLFDTGGREAARWDAERTRIASERASIEQQIRSDVARATETLALRQAAAAAERDTAADQLTQMAEVAYREGEVGILELLDAVRTAARARLRSIDVRRDTRVAQIALERAVGDILWP